MISIFLLCAQLLIRLDTCATYPDKTPMKKRPGVDAEYHIRDFSL